MSSSQLERISPRRKNKNSKNDSSIAIAIIIIIVLLVLSIGFIFSINALPDIESDIHDTSIFKSYGIDENNKQLFSSLSKKNKSIMIWPTKEDSPDSSDSSDDEENVIEVDGITIPKSTFPMSIRYEDDNFEDIIHPGDEKTVISVPKF